MTTQEEEKNLNKSPFVMRVIGMGRPYFVKTPWWLKKIYPNRIWDIKTKEKTVYLTFDDGPHPIATPFVLDELKKHNAKATFFCIGKNVAASPEIYKRIIGEGHRTGNHTYNHFNGWKTNDEVYLNDIAEAATYINSNLFRPPYGRISSSQAKQLSDVIKKEPAKIIMWDVLSGDFDESLDRTKCLKQVISKTVSGSIIVFHDSEKAFNKLEYALPVVLDFFSKSGYNFKRIEI
jgi:peptidoglycan/xylan/chitin deacetylase (PgdA/CDA1 family)